MVSKGLIDLLCIGVNSFCLGSIFKEDVGVFVFPKQSSMKPTISDGFEILFCPKCHILPRTKISKGDIIYFKSPINPQKMLLKRVQYLEKESVGSFFMPNRIPKGYVWVIGDNPENKGIISTEPLSIKLNRSVSDFKDAVFTMFFHFDNKRVRWKVYYPVAILLQHGLGPIDFVKPHTVNYENTFAYSTGKEQFKGLYEVSTKMFFIEWMILCLEEFQVTSVPEIRNGPI
ncbi:Mitochondrial inner membrane protease subunit 1 [Thelohanellus kitauei]|uniref:Mitochondrial inner membrane protease subunit 1 n=1 Tax=Thelohanellus kitauei TaxID=669202 RepID=A0A0C2M9G5_THEKT|nr:Mitochondrial inner membrane protease subunit 1 [Thelohanellus kitauei]